MLQRDSGAWTAFPSKFLSFGVRVFWVWVLVLEGCFWFLGCFWFWFGFAGVGEGRAGAVIFVFKKTQFCKFYFAKHVHTYSKQ